MAESINFEDYSVRVRLGDARITSLELTGWGAMNNGVPALKEFTDSGRLWGRFDASSGDVEMFRKPTMLPGDLVMSGNASAGSVDLTEDNSSGMSGSMDIDGGSLGSNPLEDSEFDVVVSYANELDIKRVYEGLDGEMTDGQFNGEGARMESLLKDTKREIIDPKIWDKHADEIGVDAQGRPNIAWMSSPRQLARCQAFFCAAALAERRASLNPELIDLAERYESRANDAWGSTAIAFDPEADGEIDRRGIAQNEIERG